MMQPLQAGIYRICNPTERISFVGYSLNLQGIFKRFRFELGLNSCTVKPLQAMYNAAGGKVDMEILEQFESSDPNDIGLERMLKSALEKWQKRLGENGEKVCVILL